MPWNQMPCSKLEGTLPSEKKKKVGGKTKSIIIFSPPFSAANILMPSYLLTLSSGRLACRPTHTVGAKRRSSEKLTMGAAPSRQERSSSSSCVGDGHAVPMAHSASTSDTTNQAQSKRAPAPHMFREIVAEEKVTDVAALEDQVCTGIFLAGKTKKYWVDERTRHNCFMLFPRGLTITWSEDPKFWSWHPLKEESDADAQIEAVALQDVCWLEIHGKLELSHLTPGVTYEVVFEVMLNDPAYGWTAPVNLRLKFPDGAIQQHKENLMEKPRGQWLQLKVGEVKPQKGQNGEVEISMFEYDGGEWKRGLLIKGIKIIPKK